MLEEAPVDEINNRIFHGEYFLIDTRTAANYAENRVLGSINCPKPLSMNDVSLVPSLVFVTTYCIDEDQQQVFSNAYKSLRVLIGYIFIDSDWALRLHALFQQACMENNNKGDIRLLNLAALFRQSPVLFSPVEVDVWDGSMPPSIIIDKILYLCSAVEISNPKILGPAGNLHPTHVLNLTGRLRRRRYDDDDDNDGNVKYLNLKPDDSDSTVLTKQLSKMFNFIESARRVEKGQVLIYCQTGFSKGPTFVIYYLMRSQHMSLRAAYDFVRFKRPSLFPSRYHMIQLMKAEKSLTGCSSICEEDLGKIGGLNCDYGARTPTHGKTIICHRYRSDCVIM